MTLGTDNVAASAARSPSSERVHDEFMALTPAAREQREEKLRRILRDDGTTHHAGAIAERSSRAWDLDLLPAVIDAERWAPIEAGLVERAELFNLILADLYGERTLLRDGVLPPEALLIHPGFLRPCDGVRHPGTQQLFLQAVDLLERSDGVYVAAADQTQVPRGIGYALENRTVLSRVVPKIFRRANVLRLSPFFASLRQTLQNLAPELDEPHVVLLSPGPTDATYFEHAFLANYLGLPLVQSGDIVVRDGDVWMKALDGLSRIDVILRQVRDWACDPLELQSDSFLGVPGLLHAARQGRVLLANPIGAGALENPALQRYLPAIGRHFLGREPALESIPTYWCGEADDLALVTGQLEQLVVLPIDHRRDEAPVLYPATMTADERDALRARITHRPEAFAAQRLPDRAGCRQLADDPGAGAQAITRTFCVATGSSFAVLPGGLSRRVPGSERPLDPERWSNRDTWVVSAKPLVPTASPFLDRQGRFKLVDRTPLPSRVVENLFWMGRYAERAESALRLLRTLFLTLNGPDPMPRDVRDALLLAVTRVTGTRPGFEGDGALLEDPDEELLAVVLDARRSGSVRANLAALLAAADDTKELLSSDMLRVLNDIEDANEALGAALTGGLASAPEEALDPLVTALLALAGLTQESMIRGVGWRFMELGRRLERSLQLLALCRSLLIRPLPDGHEEEALQALFLTLEMLITYRRRYRGRVELPQGFELLLIDRSNPRSLLFQLEALQGHLDELPRVGVDTRELQPEQRAALDAITTLRISPLVTLGETDADGTRVELAQLLERLRDRILTIGTVVSERYFEHREGPQLLVPTVWEGE
ncbi:MAG: circularly permuted type 2 ATP-grasp protein [Pseudomonadota bacterium]